MSGGPHTQQTGMTVMTLRSEVAPASDDEVPPAAAAEPRRTNLGRLVAGSLVAGFAAAVIFPFLPVGTVDVNFATAMVLFGWALGWALLAGLSMRFTDQPQRWAVVPAIFMAAAGTLALVASDSVVDSSAWIWTPALLLMVAWVWLRAKRDMQAGQGCGCSTRCWSSWCFSPSAGSTKGSVSPLHGRLPCAGSSSTSDRTVFTWSARAQVRRP
jgi:hypothetical protein